MHRRALVCLLSLLLLICSANQASAFKTIALEGVTIADPDFPALKVESIWSASVSDNGRVAFSGSLVGPGVGLFNAAALWTYDGAAIDLAARSLAPVAGFPADTTLGGFGRPAINNSGEVALTSSILVDGAGVDNEAIIKLTSSGATVLARQGEQAVGAAMGVNYTQHKTEPVINNAGHVAFYSLTQDGGDGIWIDRNGGVEPVVFSGMPAPGIPGATISRTSIGSTLGFDHRVSLSDQGAVAFQSWTSGLPDSPFGTYGIWIDEGEGLQLITRTDSSIAGVTGRFKYSTDFHSGYGNPVQINDSNTVAFAGLTGTLGHPWQITDFGVWTNDEFGISHLVSSGPQLPLWQAADGMAVTDINSNSDLAFSFSVTGGSDRNSVWRISAGVPIKLADADIHAPGTEPGIVFGGLSNGGGTGPPQLNDLGTLVFFAALSDEEICSGGCYAENYESLWVSQADEPARLFLRQGQLIDIDDDPGVLELRTISSLRALDDQNRRFDLSETDEVLVNLGFAEGGGGLFLISAHETFALAGLTGDYNGNHQIDAADYTVWRDAMTAEASYLPNDPTPGTVDESDFAYWREHFGNSLGNGIGSAFPATVPEPTSLGLLLVGGPLVLVLRRRIVA